MGFENLYLVSDAITYEIAGKACRKILEDAGIRNHLIQLTHTGFDEATLGELTIQMPMDCDLVIAVGTGAINGFSVIEWAVPSTLWQQRPQWMALLPALLRFNPTI